MAKAASTNGVIKAAGPGTNAAPDQIPTRANDIAELIDAVKGLVIPFIREADEAFPERAQGGPGGPAAVATPDLPARTALVQPLDPQQVIAKLQLELPEGNGGGRDAVVDTVKRILELSVNTWDQGFLDKLYASSTGAGLIGDLLLSVLNTNVHVFQVSPALTVIEKTTSQSLARLFGFTGPRAGGFTTAGGSTSNFSSVVIARNTLYPDTKVDGNGSRRFALFTSAHGHYSVEKAAQAAGLGSGAVFPVAVDTEGSIVPADLEIQVAKSKESGFTPLYINATAGTTVLGSYDPFEDISAIAKKHGLWLHIDGSWGGPAIFSEKHKHKLRGSHLADSITINPHKMLNIPVPCSYLLGPDVRIFNQANTLRAGYLFHKGEDDEEIWDLADLTLQCGRRGDSLKLALAWVYEGSAGFERQVNHAFEVASLLATSISKRPDLFSLVSANPPPCLQVCFYYRGDQEDGKPDTDEAVNTRRTSQAARLLVRRGYMVDFAPGDHGSFFRVVVNLQTRPGTIEGLVRALEIVRKEVE